MFACWRSQARGPTLRTDRRLSASELASFSGLSRDKTSTSTFSRESLQPLQTHICRHGGEETARKSGGDEVA